MNKKYIFVNATAATSGGALTILNQFIQSIKDDDKIYYIFTSVDIESFTHKNINIVNDIKAKKWKDRLKWDFIGIKRWAKKNNIFPDLIISLQNTGVIFNINIPQIIYLHQPIPFTNIKWNLFKKDERIYWLYKHIYDKIIKFTLNKNSIMVVQSSWLKEAVSKKLKLDKNKIFNFRPNFSDIDIDKVNDIKLEEGKYHIFYPAAGHKYKNHKVILDALSILKKEEHDIYRNIKVHFTLNEDSNVGILVNKLDLKDSIDFKSYIPFETTLSLYKSSDLVVFPSYIETLGLPLVEAVQFGIPILVSDLEYSRDILDGYNGAEFIDYSNARIWANAIKKQYKYKNKNFKPNFENINEWNKFFELVSSKL